MTKSHRKSKFLLAILLATSALAVFQFSSQALADDQAVGGVPLHGFTDVGFASESSHDLNRGYGKGFYLNNLDLYLAPDFGSRARMLAEVVMEPDATSQGIGIDTERLQVGYAFSNALTVWMGRFHTPIGFFVISYHHGGQLQTAIDKPRFLDWEDHAGNLPVHTTGIFATGQFPMRGEDRLVYFVWAGNGSRLTTDGQNVTNIDMNMSHDDNSDTSLGTQIRWFFSGKLEGLNTGFTAMTQRMDSSPHSNDPTSFTDQGAQFADMTNPNTGTWFVSQLNLLGVYAVYENHGFEWLNEYFNFQNKLNESSDGASGTFYSWAGYSQLAYWFPGNWAPFVRVEQGDFNKDDPFFAGQYNGLPYSKQAAGVRYNLDDATCVKAEIATTYFATHSATNSGEGYNSLKLDYAVRF